VRKELLCTHGLDLFIRSYTRTAGSARMRQLQHLQHEEKMEEVAMSRFSSPS
jgi:hypothetical protein